MSNIRDNFLSLNENRTKLAKAEIDKINAQNAIKENAVNEYYRNKEANLRKEKQHGKLLEAARNDAFAAVIKAIYITSLEAATLTDNAIMLAENTVDKWILTKLNKVIDECDKNYEKYDLYE